MAKKLFTSENQPKKKPRGKSERTKFLEALKRNSYSEDDFYDQLVSEAMAEKSPIAMSEILKRVSPIAKQVAPTITFELDKKGKPHEKAGQVLDAIADGDVPPDLGAMLINAIKAFVDLDNSDLKERIEKIEDMLNGK